MRARLHLKAPSVLSSQSACIEGNVTEGLEPSINMTWESLTWELKLVSRLFLSLQRLLTVTLSVLCPPKRWPSSASLPAYEVQKHSETHYSILTTLCLCLRFLQFKSPMWFGRKQHGRMAMKMLDLTKVLPKWWIICIINSSHHKK